MDSRILRAVILLSFLSIDFTVQAAVENPYAFGFVKKNLLDLIQEQVAQTNRVIIPPQNAADLEALKQQTVTFKPRRNQPLTPSDLWGLSKTFLEMSGYSLVTKNSFTYALVKNSSTEGGAANRDILPLYVATPIENLPNDEGRIRYVYYLSNMKVPTISEQLSSPLTKMIKEFLSKDGSIIYDTQSNALILSDKASHVASLINILKEFESKGFKEEVAYVPLAHVKAPDVAKIFDSLKKASGDDDASNRQFIRSDPSSDSLTYYTRDTRVIADLQRNGLVIMGRKANVDRISEFIMESLDQPQDTGQSVLHYYDLEYLDAKEFAPTLQKIVGSFLSGTQATQTPARRGNEHFFKGAQVVAQPVVTIPQNFTTEPITFEQKTVSAQLGIDGVATQGGNRLIVAARNDDWLLVKRLIEKLDKPQYQVVLEILIVDFSYDRTTAIASTLRSKTDSPILPGGVQFLASHISVPDALLGTTPVELAQDLLSIVGPQTAINSFGTGSLLVSFNDPQTPGVFGLLQLLERSLTAKIRSYPYLTVTNHQKGSVESEELRRTTGELVTTTNGTFTIPIEDVTATFKIIATPHIVSNERVRLDIGFTIEEFIGNSFNRTSRGLKTTATLASGQIMVMGGIVRTDSTDTMTVTPVLGHIPIFGNLWSGTRKREVSTNLVLMVSPTIIEPRSKKMAHITEEKVAQIKEGDHSLFDERDPIVRLFLKEPEEKTFDTFFAPAITGSSFVARTVKARLQRFDREKLKTLLAQENLPIGVKRGEGQFIFDGEKPIIFGNTLRSGYTAGLNLPGARANGKIGDEGIFSVS